jgi:hypothetical protein
MNLDRNFKLSFFLLLLSIFFWDLRLVAENLSVESNIASQILSNIDIRFVYLISIFPLFFYLKYFIKEKLITYKFIFISLIICVILTLHQIYSSKEDIKLIEIAYSIIIFLSILILKIFGKNFLDNKILIIKFVTLISVFFYVFSLVVFDFLEIKNEYGELLTWNKFSFEPCKSGFFNDYNFVFSESSHFGIVAISIFLTNFYFIIKTNFKDKSLLICFLAISFILFNNMSLTLIVGVVSCQFAIIFTNFNKKNIKYLISSFLMIVIFFLILFSFHGCKWKFNNALWLIKQKIPILRLNLEIMSEEEKKKAINEYQGKKYRLKVNTEDNEEIFEKNFILTKNTDLSSAVLAHNLRVVKASLNVYDSDSKIFGWGLNRYQDAFENYTKFKIEKINHTYSIYVNNEDGSMNLTKLIVEFGIFSLILTFFYIFFLFSSRIAIDDKIFLFPIIFVQTFLRGAGYFNGGFLIVTILIILIVTKSYEGKKSNKIL